MNIFRIKIFIFAIFVQKGDFEHSQFQRMGVTLIEFYLFKFYSLPVLGGSCLKLQKFFWKNIFTTEMLIQLILYKKTTLSNHSFRMSTWHSLNFYDLFQIHCRFQNKVLLKFQKPSWTNIFTIEYFYYLCTKNGI